LRIRPETLSKPIKTPSTPDSKPIKTPTLLKPLFGLRPSSQTKPSNSASPEGGKRRSSLIQSHEQRITCLYPLDPARPKGRDEFPSTAKSGASSNLKEAPAFGGRPPQISRELDVECLRTYSTPQNHINSYGLVTSMAPNLIQFIRFVGGELVFARGWGGGVIPEPRVPRYSNSLVRGYTTREGP
jgi:hypothetical protein